MNEEPNPYRPPAPDQDVELRLALRRRKLANRAIFVAIFVVLFAAYWGVRLGIMLINGWLFAHN